MRRYRFNIDATTAVLVIVTVVFFAARLGIAALGGELPIFIALGADYSPLVASGQVWRWLTAGFLHTDLLHFLLNAYALWILGRFVERFYSKRKFLIVLIFGIIAGNLLSFVLDLAMVVRDPNFTPVFSLGISGGIFGLLGLLIGASLRREGFAQELPIDRTQLFIIAGYNLFLGFLLPSINNAAHVGGLIAGVTLSFVIEPYYITFQKRWRKLLLRFLTAAIAIATFSAIILQAITAVYFFS